MYALSSINNLYSLVLCNQIISCLKGKSYVQLNKKGTNERFNFRISFVHVYELALLGTHTHTHTQYLCNFGLLIN